MFRAALDEDIRGEIERGLRRAAPEADVVSVREAGMEGRTDADVLVWAAEEGRILFTHDANTMTAAAYDRIRTGQPLPGVFIVPQSLPTGVALQGILLILAASQPGEWQGQVRYLPL